MQTPPRAAAAGILLALVLGVAGCSGSEDTGSDGTDGSAGGGRFPSVVDVELAPADDGTYTADVTISSPYDSPERYADGWRVLGPDDDVLGTWELAHDHAGEQPFTRTQTGLEIPGDVDEVTVEGHDTDNGYGGETVTVDVP